MPKAYILIGVPGSGKSSWIGKAPLDWSNTVVASTDAYVESEARLQGKTYTEIFKEVMPHAVKNMVKVVNDAIKNNQNIVWDQTSTTKYTRAKKIRMLPEYYHIIAVVLKTPDRQELNRRLAERPEKTIPDQVVNDMIAGWEEPSADEGFDKIIYVS